MNSGMVLLGENCSSALTEEEVGESCDRIWDGLHCWPATKAGTVVTELCHAIFANHPQKWPWDLSTYGQARASRECQPDAVWKGKTDFSPCLGAVEKWQFEGHITTMTALTLATVSSVALIIALIIFSLFKVLRCDRIKIHKQLMAALLIYDLSMLGLIVAKSADLLKSNDWLCKTLNSLALFGSTSSVFWMLVEGWYLNSRISTHVFETRTPHLYYRLFAWGIPSLLVVSWSIAVESHYSAINAIADATAGGDKVICWKHHYNLPWVWLFMGPLCVCLFINLIFLCNIVRILISKLRVNEEGEMAQIKFLPLIFRRKDSVCPTSGARGSECHSCIYLSGNTRKTIKATLVLFPLLGVANVIFPHDRSDGNVTLAYILFHCIINFSQGFWVSLLYCFLNGEVRHAITMAFKRRRDSTWHTNAHAETVAFNIHRNSHHRQETCIVALNSGDTPGGSQQSLKSSKTSTSQQHLHHNKEDQPHQQGREP